MTEYWPTPQKLEYGQYVNYCKMEFRAELAMRFLERWGAVAGTTDNTNDRLHRLQSPSELVDRCFLIAELFVFKAESLGLIQPIQPNGS